MSNNINHNTRIPKSLPSVQALVKQGIEVNNAGTTQRELSLAAGFLKDQASMMSMVKNGSVKLKIGRVPKFARVLKLNPMILLASTLKERLEGDEGAWELVEDILNATHTKREELLLARFRAFETKLKMEVPLNDRTLNAFDKFLESQFLIK